MNVTGRVTAINDAENGESKSGKAWTKQSMVLDTGDQFNPLVCVSFFGDKTELLKKVAIGTTVEVGINISSREFNGKFYHNIDGWKISNVGDAAKPELNTSDTEDGNLPF